MDATFDVMVLQDESGGYIAFVPELPGCHTQGDNLEEVSRNVKEAVELYLETMSGAEKKELLRFKPDFVALQKIKAHA